MKMKKTRVGLACIVAAACVSLFCSKAPEVEPPQTALEQFYRHVNAGELAEAMALYNTQARRQVEASTQRFATWAQEETRDGQFKQVRVIEESNDLGTSTLRYEVEYTDGTKSEPRSVAMTREGGQWKLGFIM